MEKCINEIKVDFFLFKTIFLNQFGFSAPGKEILTSYYKQMEFIRDNIFNKNDVLLNLKSNMELVRKFCKIVLKRKCLIAVDMHGDIYVHKDNKIPTMKNIKTTLNITYIDG